MNYFQLEKNDDIYLGTLLLITINKMATGIMKLFSIILIWVKLIRLLLLLIFFNKMMCAL